jgi:uncharacterized protein YkwD
MGRLLATLLVVIPAQFLLPIASVNPIGYVYAGDEAEGLTVEIKSRLLTNTNKARKRIGAPAVRESKILSRIALLHTRNMCALGALEHESSRFPEGGRTFHDRIKIARVSSAAENIALRSHDRDGGVWADHVVKGWLNSPGHKKNMLNPDYAFVGIGVVSCADKIIYTTMVFSPEPGKDQPGTK